MAAAWLLWNLLAAAAPADQPPLPPESDYLDAVPYPFLVHIYWIVPLIQIVALVHAVKTGRGRQWAWIILIFPLVGAAVYAAVEVLPDLRGSAPSLLDRVLNAIRPGREMARLQEQLEIADTIENRKALAAACLRAGRHAQAVELYRGCLTGAMKDDAQTALELAGALVQAGELQAARDALEALRQAHPGHKPLDRDLLLARALDRLGRAAEARAAYQALAGNPRCDGEEARCRLAQMLEAAGEPQRAKPIYQDILKRAKAFSRQHLRTERGWVAQARRGIRRIRRGDSRPADAARVPNRNERRR